jgi:hypothetical protein
MGLFFAISLHLPHNMGVSSLGLFLRLADGWKSPVLGMDKMLPRGLYPIDSP